MNTRRVRSKYDSYFQKTEKSAKCLLCSQILAYSSASGPNNLKFHLSSKHSEEQKKLEEEELSTKKRRIEAADKLRLQSTIPFLKVSDSSFRTPQGSQNSYLDRLNVWDEGGQRSEEIENAIMKMIVVDNLPFRTVEKLGFLGLMKAAAPKFKIKSRNYYSYTLFPKLYESVLDSVKLQLKTMRKLSITTDGWTSKDGRHSLLSVTGHWINSEDFTPKVVILASAVVKGRHTAQNLSEIIRKTLNDFNIPMEKLVCIIRDGAPNMESTCRKLDVPSFQCYAHLLQLAVKDVIEKISGTYSETEVRWSSMYLMLKSFIENKKVVCLLKIENDDLKLPEISSEDWENAQLMLEVLQPIAQTTKSLQGRFEASISVVIPSLCVMEFNMEQSKSNLKDQSKAQFIDSFLTMLKERTKYLHKNDFIKTCTFIDPRFKDGYFQDSHKEYIVRLLKHKAGVVEQDLVGSDDIECVTIQPKSMFEEYLGVKNPVPILKPQDPIQKEVNDYLLMPSLSTTDPFKFWDAQKTFPHLKNLASELMSIPATSSESERLFSLSGLICSPRRSNMTSQKLDQLTFCAMNLKLLG